MFELDSAPQMYLRCFLNCCSSNHLCKSPVLMVVFTFNQTTIPCNKLGNHLLKLYLFKCKNICLLLMANVVICCCVSYFAMLWSQGSHSYCSRGIVLVVYVV